MDKHRIAVIIAGIDQSYQSTVLKGMEQSAEKCGLELYAFVSLGGALETPRHDTGEMNIFNLPDLSSYDGAVLLTNTINDAETVESIINRIREAGIPAVSIDNDIEGMYHIGIDNRKAMRRMTEHFIDIHGFTRFCYVSGPKDNPESTDRLEAFRKVLSERGISCGEDCIYYGDFRAPSGKSAVEAFLSRPEKLPQVIICANDAMAASVVGRLFKEGISVPDDIAVSGFDNTYDRYNYQMELTTVDRPLMRSGELACEKLCRHFRGEEQERSVTLEMSVHFGESCGCQKEPNMAISDIRELNYINYKRFEDTQEFMASSNRLSCRLLACKSFDEYIAAMKDFVSYADPEEFCLCLCDNWDDDSFIRERDSEVPVPSYYTEEIYAAIIYRNGSFLEPVTIKRTELLPAAKGGRNGISYVIPLHFAERCLGYMSVRRSRISIYNSMFQSWCISISNSLENMRKFICLENAVEHLGRLYARDTFSGIYNRNGFVRATEELYDQCVKENRCIMLMFIDLDGLKKINDTYGHDVGDRAICNIADVLKMTCVQGEVYCRFGGDEFIIFAPDVTPKEARRLTEKIQKNISEVNAGRKNPYELSASTGYIIAHPKEGDDIFDFVTQADKVMYEEKRRKHSEYLRK